MSETNNSMDGADAFFATSLEKIILDNLGESTSRKIQDRLFERYGISMTTAIREFEKLDSVLREFFGNGAEGLEKKFLDNICCINSKQDKIEKRFTILDESIIQLILDTFRDKEMLTILNASIGEPWTISEMIDKLNIPKTSAYRKINILIETGLLVPTGYVLIENRRKVKKFKALFDNVNIDFGNKPKVNVQFTPEIAAKSSILQTVYGL